MSARTHRVRHRPTIPQHQVCVRHARHRSAWALATALAALLVAPALARAGVIWTDADGDGLPDAPGTLVATAGDVVSVDVWIDSQSFTWTNYLVYVEWPAACMTYVSAEYLVSGGTNFPVDDFSHPSAVGFGGNGYLENGIDRIGRVSVRLYQSGACCLTPIIDVYNPYYVFSQLGNWPDDDYFLFTSNPSSCWTVNAVPEACCFADTSCSMLTPDECVAAGGTPQGFGTECGSVTCVPPPPRGACCLPSGACTDPVTEPACAAMGGDYQGDNTACASVSCPVPPPPTGACCYPSGLCDGPITLGDCAAGGGSFMGDGSDCATVTCPSFGACCFMSPHACIVRTAAECAAVGGSYMGDGTDCSPDPCPWPPGPTGACCLGGTCIGEMTRAACSYAGGVYRGDGTTCATPGICDIPTGCSGAALSSALSVFPLRESAGASGGPSSPGAPCALAASTNGTAANYRWYNICSGYIWIYAGWAQGEGVGVLFGGPQQPAVDGSNDAKRVITYFRNVVANYSQTVDVHLDSDWNGDGCPDASIAKQLDLDPGLRWNCSEFNANIPCGDVHVIVRTMHDGGAAPSFATDGPFTTTCDPYAPGRSYYYSADGSGCSPWCGPDDTFDNFLYWLILDYSDPCIIAVEPTTWGRIKGMFR